MRRGFSLLELMIGLAMLAIVAAICAPNWADSSQRSKTSRARADMRMVATALESYETDFGQYPYDGCNYNFGAGAGWFNFWFLPHTITTPVAYLSTNRVPDPHRRGAFPLTAQVGVDMRYVNVDSTWGSAWDAIQTGAPGASVYYPARLADFGRYCLTMVGPDGSVGPSGFPSPGTLPPFSYPASQVAIPYDPTNGVHSTGDMIRTEIRESGYPNTQP